MWKVVAIVLAGIAGLVVVVSLREPESQPQAVVTDNAPVAGDDPPAPAIEPTEQELPQPQRSDDRAMLVDDGETLARRARPQRRVGRGEGMPPVDHAYTVHTDAELAELANTDADAAVILARRSYGPIAEFWYERGTILSGLPAPLIEWNEDINDGGFNGGRVVDIDGAIAAYETMLICVRLGLSAEVAGWYAEALTAEGVDLEPIRARAADRFERMTAERLELTGEAWPE